MMADDLAWDFSGDSIDSAPLLDGFHGSNSVFYGINSREQDCRITRRQMEYIIRNLEESASVLRGYLALNQQQSAPPANRRQCCGCWKSCRIPPFLADHLLIFTVIIQALNLIVLSIIDEFCHSKKEEQQLIDTGSAIMIALEVLNLVLVIVTSAKLTNQIVMHNVSSYLLAQSYLASILLFGGIYTVTFRVDHRSWKFINENDIDIDPLILIDIFLRMLYLSASTATLCGASSLGPKEWYNYLFMSLQMLLSFIYFTSILSRAMSFISPRAMSAQLTKRHRTNSAGSLGSRNSTIVNYGTIGQNSNETEDLNVSHTDT